MGVTRGIQEHRAMEGPAARILAPAKEACRELCLIPLKLLLRPAGAVILDGTVLLTLR